VQFEEITVMTTATLTTADVFAPITPNGSLRDAVSGRFVRQTESVSATPVGDLDWLEAPAAYGTALVARLGDTPLPLPAVLATLDSLDPEGRDESFDLITWLILHRAAYRRGALA